MESKQTFGAYICHRRKELGMTQKEFAQRLFVTDSAVSKWERGLAYPDITLLQSICEILQISEKELLRSGEDTEGRRVEQLARKYQRLSRNYRIIQYVLYGLTALICFLCNLAVQHTLSWFWIVLASELMCASLTLLPVMAPEGRRGQWSLSTFTVSLLLLLLICCLYTGGAWFPVAAVATLFGMSLVFLPLVLRWLPLPETLQTQRFSLYVGVVTALLLAMLAVICVTWAEGWFFTAAAAILFGVGLVFGPVILKKLPLRPPFAGRKPLLYAAEEVLLLILLYGVCCLQSGGRWFVSASLWTVFGLTVVLLPFLMRQLPLPLAWQRHKALTYFCLESVYLLLSLAYEGVGDWFPIPGLLLALLGLSLPWGWLGAMRYLPIGRWFRAAVGCFWTGLWAWLCPWLMDRSLALRGWSDGGLHPLRIPFDLSDWMDLCLRSGNIYVLTLLGIGLLGVVCIGTGLVRKKRRS